MEHQRTIVAREWVWVPMPEKRYRGRVTISSLGSEIEMIDPVPNKLDDECYGESTNAKTVDQAVKMFTAGMLQDRRRFAGSDWRPDRAQLQRLWKRRGERRAEIE